jgi:hypothetical protein
MLSMTAATPVASVWFRVAGRVHFPVRADDQDLLAIVRPPCPQNVWVVDPIGRWVVRRTHFEEGKLWTALGDLADAGQLMLLHAPDAQLLPYLVQSGQMAPRVAMRVLAGRSRAG